MLVRASQLDDTRARELTNHVLPEGWRGRVRLERKRLRPPRSRQGTRDNEQGTGRLRRTVSNPARLAVRLDQGWPVERVKTPKDHQGRAALFAAVPDRATKIVQAARGL